MTLADITEIHEILESRVGLEGNEFNLLASLSRIISDPDTTDTGRDLLIRALETANAFELHRDILDTLLREVGLFPYLDQTRLGVAEQIAYEFHRPRGLPRDIVFHSDQARVFRSLLNGESVILSAPTSYGKSLIIDAVIATQRYSNIVIVVPTIALIDETRQRLSQFSDHYKIITHQSQAPEAHNIFVLTQERVIERDDLERTDFFVIDEFYKLDPFRVDAEEEHSFILNHAFYKLLRTTSRFYMLEPSIKSVSAGLGRRFECRFIHTDYRTVLSDIVRVPTPDGIDRALVELLSRLDEPTLIYCASPNSVRKITSTILSAGILKDQPTNRGACDWVSEQYNSEWLFVRALEYGIGVHHGRIPRALAQLNVRLFNSNKIKILVCTSTLIEAVNTSARNVVIYDHRVGRTGFDFFTFNNISGRAGRMFRHFIGTVFLFRDPPDRSFLEVEIPVFDHDEKLPSSLAVQIAEDDLGPDASTRVAQLQDQTDLSVDTIKANSHVSPENQLELARTIMTRPDLYHADLV